jgi:hypothetical protein
MNYFKVKNILLKELRQRKRHHVLISAYQIGTSNAWFGHGILQWSGHICPEVRYRDGGATYIEFLQFNLG